MTPAAMTTAAIPIASCSSRLPRRRIGGRGASEGGSGVSRRPTSVSVADKFKGGLAASGGPGPGTFNHLWTFTRHDGRHDRKAEQADAEDAVGRLAAVNLTEEAADRGARDDRQLGDREAAAHDGPAVGAVAGLHERLDVAHRVDRVARAGNQQEHGNQPDPGTHGDPEAEYPGQ